MLIQSWIWSFHFFNDSCHTRKHGRMKASLKSLKNIKRKKKNSKECKNNNNENTKRITKIITKAVQTI